ncbi:MAG: hypothetical protein M3N32_11925 [Actinomycetota bacterium]|nr:hypothetical protein [Actinomycetota bacterium]
MGARKDQRFECGCGAEVVYTKDCPDEWLGSPRCVCGREMRALATRVGHTYPDFSGGGGATESAATGQKFICECGSKVKYTKPNRQTTVAPFTCTCGATGTETRTED